VKASVPAAERWRGYFAFWVGAALLLIGLGVATLVAVHHGRRLAVFLVFLGAGCVAIAFLVRRARPRSDR
jgi:hypothetical protein